MNAENITIEWDEDGCHLIVEADGIAPMAIPDSDNIRYDFVIEDPEQLYDRVKGAIGPWLYEREQAFREFKAQAAAGAFHCDPDESGGYDTSDPKHPAFHSTHADIWDAREGK